MKNALDVQSEITNDDQWWAMDEIEVHKHTKAVKDSLKLEL